MATSTQQKQANEEGGHSHWGEYRESLSCAKLKGQKVASIAQMPTMVDCVSSFPTILMDASHLIAQLYGLLCVVVGIGVCVNPTRYKKLLSGFFADPGFLYFGGAFALTVGYLIVTFGPNVWEVSFEGLITLIGWVALIKGIILLIQPELLKDHTKFWTSNMQMTSLISLILGGALCYYGFVL